MPSTVRLGFEYPAVTDAPNGPAQILALAQDVDDYLTAAWTTYTPALTASTTNPTLGSGSSVVGRYKRIGSTVHARFLITFGTSGTSAGSGFYYVSLPVTGTALTLPAGSGYLFDSSTGVVNMAHYKQNTTATVESYYHGSIVNNSSPWAWAAGDQIGGFLTYEAGF